jgi:hypothetical protein
LAKIKELEKKVKMTTRLKTIQHQIDVEVLDLGQDLLVETDLVQRLCFADGYHTDAAVEDMELRDRLARAGYIYIKDDGACYATYELRKIAAEEGLIPDWH